MTGFCDAEETLSETGTTFIWPETRGNDFALFICPLSPSFNATRLCDIGGEWLLFDETSCGVLLGILNTLNDSFSNVRLLLRVLCACMYLVYMRAFG